MRPSVESLVQPQSRTRTERTTVIASESIGVGQPNRNKAVTEPCC